MELLAKGNGGETLQRGRPIVPESTRNKFFEAVSELMVDDWIQIKDISQKSLSHYIWESNSDGTGRKFATKKKGEGFVIKRVK